MKLQTLKPLVSTISTAAVKSGDAWRDGRNSAAARLYDRWWRRESKAFLREHPLCQCGDCDEGRKLVTLAQCVDHKIPHRGDVRLFRDRGNWQSMSLTCHNRKTARGE